MKKVSIIVPIYNVEFYLRKCLDSIINQSYSNLEIILIDDGSTDRSGEICDEYSKLDNRIIVIHNNNKGVSYSRNYGIRLSTGKYILFIDSDDTVDKNYVYYLLMENKDDKYDIVYCGIRDIFEYKKKCIIKDRLIKENRLSGELKKDYYFLIELLRVSVVKLYNADIIKKYEILFSENISSGEDQIFNFKYYKHVKKYKLINLPLYNYYHRENKSLSKIRNIRAFEMIIKKLEEEKKFLYDLNVNYKETIFNNHVIDAIKDFTILEDSDNTYKFCKKRIHQLSNFLEEKYKYSTWKKYLVNFFLKKNFYLPVYLICLFNYYKNKKRK